MANAFTLTIKVSGSGDYITDFEIAPTWSTTSGHGPRGPENVTLAAGFNALTTPTDATTPPKYCLIIPASTSGNTKTIKGLTGDTGPSPLGWTNQMALIPLTSAGVFGVTSTAQEVVSVLFF